LPVDSLRSSGGHSRHGQGTDHGGQRAETVGQECPRRGVGRGAVRAALEETTGHAPTVLCATDPVGS